jgi:hypothetical protein
MMAAGCNFRPRAGLASRKASRFEPVARADAPGCLDDPYRSHTAFEARTWSNMTGENPVPTPEQARRHERGGLTIDVHTFDGVYWTATLADYDGPPDSCGAGLTEDDAIQDLLEKLDR